MTNRFALFRYSTENIGDEVQSIAARRFLPRIDEYIDRDQLNNYSFDSPIALIMNGWYNRNAESWPPAQNAKINPLLISMHVSTKDQSVVKSFLSPTSREFLLSNGPVGARDQSTLEFFQKNDIPAYFSGCLTLTLQKDPDIKKQEFILAVDTPPGIAEAMRQRTKRPVIELSVYHFPFLSNEDRFYVAEYFLFLYQSAAAVVTTRLHAMLPSLALETPVLLIKDNEKYEPKRYGGLENLVRSATIEEFMNDEKLFPLDNPTKNPTDYIAVRDGLIERAKAFTGYSNDKTFRTIDLAQLPTDPRFIRAFAFGWSSTFPKALREGDLKWAETRINDYKNIIKRQKATINRQAREIEVEIDKNTKLINSKSWRYTAPLRSLKDKLRR